MIREALVDNLLINEESSLKSRTRNYAVLSEAGNSGLKIEVILAPTKGLKTDMSFKSYLPQNFEKRAGGFYFQRPFLRGLFLERLIFGGAYLRREICVSKSIELALQFEVNLPFLLCSTLYLRAIFQVQDLGGLIFGGAI